MLEKDKEPLTLDEARKIIRDREAGSDNPLDAATAQFIVQLLRLLTTEQSPSDLVGDFTHTEAGTYLVGTLPSTDGPFSVRQLGGGRQRFLPFKDQENPGRFKIGVTQQPLLITSGQGESTRHYIADPISRTIVNAQQTVDPELLNFVVTSPELLAKLAAMVGNNSLAILGAVTTITENYERAKALEDRKAELKYIKKVTVLYNTDPGEPLPNIIVQLPKDELQKPDKITILAFQGGVEYACTIDLLPSRRLDYTGNQLKIPLYRFKCKATPSEKVPPLRPIEEKAIGFKVTLAAGSQLPM